MKNVYHAYIRPLIRLPFFLLILAAGLFFTDIAGKMALRVIETHTWNRTPCTITSSIIESPTPRNPVYTYTVQYVYEFNGREHHSSKYSTYRTTFTYHDDAAEIADAYPAGAIARCYVNPDDPSEAVLARQNLATVLLVLFPVIFVVYGASGLYSTCRGAAGRGGANRRPIRSNGGRRKKTGPGISIVIPSAFTVLGAQVTWIALVQPTLAILIARDWDPAPCTIQSSRVQVHEFSTNNLYSIEIEYRYTYRGKTFHGDRYNFTAADAYLGYSGKRAVVRQYPPGTQATCYVNPDAPGKAVLDRSLPWGAMLYGLIPLGFLLIGITWLRVALGPRHRRKPKSYRRSRSLS